MAREMLHGWMPRFHSQQHIVTCPPPQHREIKKRKEKNKDRIPRNKLLESIFYVPNPEDKTSIN